MKFWDQSLKDFYDEFWLPPNNSNNDSKDIKYLTNLLEPSDTPPPTKEFLFCRKIRIYPNDVQTIVFNRCIGASRYFYNKSIAFLNSEGTSGNLHIASLRSKIMHNDKYFIDNSTDPESWQCHVPYDTRQEAIRDAIKAFKSAFSNLKNKNIKEFSMGFRTKKKALRESFKVNHKALNIQDISLMQQAMKKEHKRRNTKKTFKNKLRIRKRDIKKYFEDGTLCGNFSIIKEKHNKWYLCLPRKREEPVFNNPQYQSVFLDPGVRTFVTWYCPEGTCGKIDTPTKLKNIASKHDKLHSLYSKTVKPKTKVHIKQRMATYRQAMKNIVDNLHWQTCSYLSKNFKMIFTTEFEVSKMVKGSPLGSAITRKMLSLSHGRFRERLRGYGEQRQSIVRVVPEDYTTVTCGGCGNIKKMEDLKVYECCKCNLKIDRDINGARNICLKTITPLLKEIVV
jgi:putative transposase